VGKSVQPVFRLPTEQDILTLAKYMRQADINDLQAVGYHCIETAIRESIARSRQDYLTAIEVDGQLVCIFGCAEASLLSPVGVPWLLCTVFMRRHIKESTIKTRLVVQHMLTGWPVLQNVVDARNTQTIRWLQLVGFVMGEPFIYPGTGFCVVPFEARRL
jgi:hypothetical protein